MWYNLEYGYDLNNNITKFVYRTPQRGVVSQYEYGLDNLLSKFYINNTRSVSYEYDSLNRLEKTSLSTDRVIDTTYTYYDSERTSQNSNITLTTSKLETETIDGVTYKYIYDAYGNITHIQKMNGNTAVNLYYYEYDSMNQLTYVRDYENSKIYSYSYDTGGNLLVENISDVNSNGTATNTQSIRYAYGDSNWTDKLTSYNGQTITYDAIGNPLTYRDGMTMTWKNGRQLATLQDDENDITYNYDSNSVRISKNVNGVEYTYTYLNGMLVYETRGEAKFYYSYDSNGILYSVKYTLTDDSELLTYYYTHNSRGDIIGIYNGSGDLKAHYEYDAWGNILSITDADGNAITSATHIGNLNPFRYRGYYYDNETGLYYLMSRYYDPVTHRFLNADGYFQSGGNILDSNMSAYCRNNPIMFVDYFGNFVCSTSISADATFIYGINGSITVAGDSYGNQAVQASYAGTNLSENPYFGVIDAGISMNLGIYWDLDNVNELAEKKLYYIGGSAGFGGCFGLDFVFSDEGLEGFVISPGVGVGADFHTYTSTTNTIYSTYQSSNETKKSVSTPSSSSTTTTKTVRCCRTCGRPDYMCSFPTYY